MNAEIWRHLGIAPSASEAEVRRAYAERLKTTHPEDDPEGFKRLRNAYERAMEEVRWRTQYAADDVEEHWGDESRDADAAEADYKPPRLADLARGPSPQTSAPPAPDAELDAHQALSHALEQAVAKGASPWEVQAAFKALVRNPAMERINIYAATETWIANLLRRHGSAGALFDYALAHFKWANPSGHLGAGMIAFRESLAEEGKAKAFLARVQDRRHEFHGAFNELSRPMHERNRWSKVVSFPRIDMVRRFLDYVEDKVPHARNQINYQAESWWRRRINFWMTPLSFISRLAPVAVIVGVVALFVIFGPGESASPASHSVFRARAACAESVENQNADQGACDSFLQRAPDSLLMRQYAGIIALREQRYDDARRHFQRILEVSLLDPAANYGLSLALHGGADPAEQARAIVVMRDALAIDDTISIHFAQYGLASPITVDPAAVVPSVSDGGVPSYDAPAGAISLENGQSAFDAAYAHFGIVEGFPDGRVLLRCMSRATGRFTDCQIIEETPRNGGGGEVALRIMTAAIAAPATLNGEPVDGVPIRVPVTFRLLD